MLPQSQAIRVPGMGSPKMVQESLHSRGLRTKSGSTLYGAVRDRVTWTKQTDVFGRSHAFKDFLVSFNNVSVKS
jgi:hypothetical protein